MSTDKYVPLMENLREAILARRYGIEGGLPTVKELAAKWNLSQNAVRQALARLEGMGLIEKRGQNHYVRFVEQPMTRRYLPPIAARMAFEGRQGYHKNLVSPVRIKLPVDVADMYGLPHTQRVVYRYRLGIERLNDGSERPFRIATYYYVLPLADEQIEELKRDPDLDFLVAVGPAQLKAHNEIISRECSHEERRLLELDANTSVTEVNTATMAENGEVLLIQRLVLLEVILAYDYSFLNREE